MAGKRVQVFAPDGTAGTIDEDELAAALDEGFKTADQVREAELQAEYGTIGGKAATLAESIPRGLTLGMSDMLSAGAAGLAASSIDEGPQLTPEAREKAAALGIELPEAGAGRTSFGEAYDAARGEQNNRRDANPTTAIAGEVAGAVAPMLVGGGLAMAPAALAERAGAGVAKGLGGAAPGIGRAALAGAAGGATEGAIAGLTVGASQLSAAQLQDPESAAEHLLSATKEGLLIGGLAGGIFGGGARALSGGAAKLDGIAARVEPEIAPTQLPQQLAPEQYDGVVKDLYERPIFSGEVAEPQRGVFAGLVARQQAAKGGFEQGIAQGTENITRAFDDFLLSGEMINVHAGIGAKVKANALNVPHAVAAPEVDEMFNAMRENVHGFLQKYPEQSLRSGGGMAAIKGFSAELDQTEALVRQHFQSGNIGEAYSLLDQQIKGYLGKARDGSKSPLVKKLFEDMYPMPQQLLEREDLWGEAVDRVTGEMSMAGRQKLVNPTWSKAIKASQDAKVQGYTYRSGEAALNGWDPRHKANDTAIASLLGRVGNPGTRAEEVSFRTLLRARTEDAINRAKAFGTPELEAEASKMAASRKFIEDEIDRVSQLRRDAIAGGAQLQSAAADVVGAAVGIMNPAAGFGIAAGSRLAKGALAAVAEAGQGIVAKVSRSAAQLAQGAASGIEKAAPGATMAAVVYGAMLPEEEHQQAIAEAQALSQAGSPQTQQLFEAAAQIEQEDPQLAMALTQKTIGRAAYIASKLPKKTQQSMFQDPPAQDPITDRRVRRSVAAAYMPAAALDRLSRDVGSAEDLDAIKRLYPAMRRGFANDVQQHLQRAKKPPTYQQRIKIAALTGLDVDPSLRPLSIARAQAASALPDQQAAGEQQAAATRQARSGAQKGPKLGGTDRDAVYASGVDSVLDRR